MIHYQNENITVFQSALYKTTTTLIETTDAVILVDPNWLPNEVDEIKSYVGRVLNNRKLYLIFTHSDFDHIIAAGAFPNATVIASKAFANNPNKEHDVQQIKKFDAQYYLTRNYSIYYPTVDMVIEEDGQKLELASLTFIFYLAPGHTNDGLFTIVEQQGILLAGDYLSDVEFPFIYSSYADYVATMEKAEGIFHKHGIHTLVPGHGTVTTKPSEIAERIMASKMYLQSLVNLDSKLEGHLQKKYRFFDGMKDAHHRNLDMVKMEE
ncbi:hydrolase glyoxylase [Solibacillus sp. R5-41]|uniref:MBL fold metallo-hydrolase n=1 Tax=Solibacillus sp. R5-41 TaxID=2048654 RepID=UPI000C124792|nr:MBL fold metallo-hydrolase [Solibacillus sp. R5-41]ATP39475.1 hydrolase glyoxylase [Solibacillus sp. R5-41]